MLKYDSYIICTSPRSGSTLLCRLLSATGISGHPASLFFDPSVEEWCVDLGVVWNKDHSERDILQKIIESALSKGRSANGLFGLRHQAHGLKFLCEKLAIVYPDEPTDAHRFKRAFGNVLYIHLSRPDKVAQAVSYQKAKQTGLWHIAPDGSEIERNGEPAEPIYDVLTLKHYVEMMTTFDIDWNFWFENQEITPIRVSYDDLSSEPNAVLADILECLGLDRTIANNIKPGVKKLADQINQSWISKFKAEHGIS